MAAECALVRRGESAVRFERAPVAQRPTPLRDVYCCGAIDPGARSYERQRSSKQNPAKRLEENPHRQRRERSFEEHGPEGSNETNADLRVFFLAASLRSKQSSFFSLALETVVSRSRLGLTVQVGVLPR